MHSYLTVTCLLAAIAHSALGYGSPAFDHLSFPEYKFNYDVNDPHTGDKKSQWESRVGDSVKGSYSLLEPDGRTRVVDYTADDHNGYNAVVKHIGPEVQHEPQSSPRYKFNYAVNDPHTGDKKSQWESRDGDSVKGSYSLVEPDGRTRVVDYMADDHNGFNAIVKHIGSAHPSPVMLLQPEPMRPAAMPMTLSPKAVSTANMIQFFGRSYPLGSHQAELPLHAGPGAMPGSIEVPKVEEEKPIAMASLPIFTVKHLWHSRDGKRTWSSGPIPFMGGDKVIFKHHY